MTVSISDYKKQIENITQSMVDDIVSENVDFLLGAGMEPIITRTSTGKCCNWCSELEGEYKKSEAPDDIYKRHSSCNCIVTYTSDKRTQNAHTKQWLNDKEYEEVQHKMQKKSPINGNDTGKINTVKKQILKNNIEELPIKKVAKKLSEDEIISKICGGDMTKGSCSSLSLAYVGNKAGYDVLDFRGGESRGVFANPRNIETIANFEGVNSKIVRNTNNYKAVSELLPFISDGNEYVLCTGRHSAIVKKADKDMYYLELQSPTDNGYKKLTTKELKNRFKCQKTHSTHGATYDVLNIAIEVETLYNSDEFIDLLKYINTSETSQKKGILGNVK